MDEFGTYGSFRRAISCAANSSQRACYDRDWNSPAENPFVRLGRVSPEWE
jgi:hypothetical protein